MDEFDFIVDESDKTESFSSTPLSQSHESFDWSEKIRSLISKGSLGVEELSQALQVFRYDILHFFYDLDSLLRYQHRLQHFFFATVGTADADLDL